MAEREAAVRLTLNEGQFVTNIRKAGDAVDTAVKSSTRSANAWSAGLNAGLDNAKSSLTSLGGKIKETIGMAAGLGGAFALGDAVHKSLAMREQFRDIEFQINKTGKATTTWKDLIEDARKAAEETGQTTDEMGNVLESLFAKTGDADFAVGALESIGHAASASGKSLDAVGNVAQVLKRKFHASLDDLPEMLAVFLEKTDAGGLSLEAMGDKFALMAGEAEAAGLRGKEGLSTLLGVMETLDSRVGEKAEPALKKLFQIFREGSKDVQALQKEGGIKFAVDSTALDKMRALMATDRGRKALQEKLGGEARVVYDELAKPFEEAFEQARAQGKSAKEATATGLKEFDAAIARMGKSTLDYQHLVKESKGGQEDDPMLRIRDAQERFVKAIANDQMFEAIDKLAKHLPAFADALASIVTFTAGHPLLAAGGALAATAGGSFAKSSMDAAIGGAIERVFKGAVVRESAASAGSIFAKNAFAVAGVAGAAAVLTAVLVEGLTTYFREKDKAKGEEDTRTIVARADALKSKIKDASSMSEEDAALAYGGAGLRWKPAC